MSEQDRVREAAQEMEAAAAINQAVADGTIVHVHHHDIEAHAASYNEGYADAVAHGLQDDPIKGREWLDEHVAERVREALAEAAESFAIDCDHEGYNPHRCNVSIAAHDVGSRLLDFHHFLADPPGPTHEGKLMANIDPRDAARGIYAKYDVRRVDNSPRHPDCRYFVLDLTHDPHARAAARAYADSCEADYPALAADLRTLADPPAPDGDAEGSAT